MDASELAMLTAACFKLCSYDFQKHNWGYQCVCIHSRHRDIIQVFNSSIEAVVLIGNYSLEVWLTFSSVCIFFDAYMGKFNDYACMPCSMNV